MKLSEIRETSTAELKEEVKRLKREIFAARFLFASGDEDAKAHQMRQTRKTIARILTVLREREMAEL